MCKIESMTIDSLIENIYTLSDEIRLAYKISRMDMKIDDAEELSCIVL